jgi:hypothetical protein
LNEWHPPLQKHYTALREKLSDYLHAVPIINKELRPILLELAHHGFDISKPTADNSRLRCNQIIDEVLARRGALRELARLLYKYDGTEYSKEFYIFAFGVLPEPYVTLLEKIAAIEKLEEACQAENLAHYYRTVVKSDPAKPLRDVSELIYQASQNRAGTGDLDPLIYITALIAKDTRNAALAAECRALRQGRHRAAR